MRLLGCQSTVTNTAKNKTVLSEFLTFPENIVLHIYLSKIPHSRYTSAIITLSLAMTSAAFVPEFKHSTAAMLHDFLSGLFCLKVVCTVAES